jgi:hypothetical protein
VIRLALLSASVVGCAASARETSIAKPGPAAPSSYGCQGAADPDEPVAPAVPMGRLEVSRTANGVRVLAEDVPVSKLAVRIGEALGVDTRIDADLEHVTVSMFAPEITIDSLAERLEPRDVVISKQDWQKHRVLVVRNSSNWGGTARHPDLEGVQSMLFDPEDDATAEQLAGLFCRTFASSVGTAQVMGRRVVIFDRGTRLRNFGAALKTMHAVTARDP